MHTLLLAALLAFLAVHVPAVAASRDDSAGACCRIELEKMDLEPFEEQGRFGYRVKGHVAVAIAPRFHVALPFSETRVAAVVDDDGWAWINTKGEVLLRPHVVDNGPDPFRDGLSRFVHGARIGFMDTAANIVIEATFAYAEPFAKGYALVCADCIFVAEGEHTRAEGTRWGVIDLNGKPVVTLEHPRERAVEQAEKLRKRSSD